MPRLPSDDRNALRNGSRTGGRSSTDLLPTLVLFATSRAVSSRNGVIELYAMCWYPAWGRQSSISVKQLLNGVVQVASERL